jgi:hypothetical protein
LGEAATMLWHLRKTEIDLTLDAGALKADFPLEHFFYGVF